MFIEKILSKECPSFEIWINQEKPFLRILGLKLLNKKISEVLGSEFLIKYKIIKENGDYIDDNLHSFGSILNHDGNDYFTLDQEIEEVRIHPVKIIKFKIHNPKNEEIQVALIYQTIDLCVSMENPFEGFKKYIGERGNSKILFSAPFGQGKTTFLKHFFKNNYDQYEYFHLFPVNYSVSLNEDIFKYIKCEILFELLEKDVEFDKERFTYLQTLPSFVLKNSHQILAPFINLLPGIGKSAYDIYQKLFSLSQKYFKEHAKRQKDDEKEAEKFIKELYESEGSIYEDNFYTQLIRQLITQIKEKGKETVLIIDDLDRIDPEHIFRILNVFAAHFDTPEFDSVGANKFGFDKIIIVADYQNLKKIFCHRYGSSTDFNGYIDKFFSKNVYEYDNKKAMCALVFEFNIPVTIRDIYQRILLDLINTDNLSLRELLKLRKIEKKFLIRKAPPFDTIYTPIFLLNEVIEIESILNKFKRCKERIAFSLKERAFYNFNTFRLIVPLASLINENGYNHLYDYDSRRIKFSFSPDNNFSENLIVNDKLFNINDFEFNEKDFYEILTRLTLKYIDQKELTSRV